MKRRVFLSSTFILLITGLVVLWSLRFERSSYGPALTLADLRVAAPILPSGATWEGNAANPVLRLRVDTINPQIGMRLELPGFPAMEAVHIRYSMAAKGLKLGPQKWDDGRVLIEWCPPGAEHGKETDPIGSLRDSECSDDISLVARASSGLAIPVLRIEHLGLGGELEVSRLELIPVKERSLWKTGRWVILAGFFAWLWVWLSSSSVPAWKIALVSGLWLVLVIQFSVPGPWKTLRPLMLDFQLGTAPVGAVAGLPAYHGNIPSESDGKPVLTSESEILGKIPDHGSWIVRAKNQFAMFRPAIHALLLFAPALVFAFFMDRKHAFLLAVAFALSIEASQTAFGYGFDWVDVFDLATDLTGIMLAMWVHRKFSKC